MGQCGSTNCGSLLSGPVCRSSPSRWAAGPSDSHPLCFGYADPALNRGAAEAFRVADLFLVLGKRIDFRLGLGGPRVIPTSAKVVQVDIHAGELGLNRRLDIGICADVRGVLQALLAATGKEPWPELPWVDAVRGMRANGRRTASGGRR